MVCEGSGQAEITGMHRNCLCFPYGIGCGDFPASCSAAGSPRLLAGQSAASERAPARLAGLPTSKLPKTPCT